MFRWVRRGLLVVALVVVAVVIGGAILLLTARGDLDRSKHDVTTQWSTLRTALDARYTALSNLNDAVKNAGGPDRALVGDVTSALDAWRTGANASVATQVRDANDLEAVGRR